MRMTASHIVDWVNTHTKEAQQNLPRLIRRLCFDSRFTQQIAFPSGDSTYVPGWDGITRTDNSNAWVPSGNAVWEIGCDQDIQSKANRDYKKRTDQTDEQTRQNSTFIFVTPRRWIQKVEWINQRNNEGNWLSIRVYDADDLEQWLEQTPAIAVQFSEELGLAGWGVMSPKKYWDNWSHQCSPKILSDVFIGDRTKIHKTLKETIIKSLSTEHAIEPIIIRADSVEEAIAFATITITESEEVTGKTLVVTEPEGWQFVDTNVHLRIAIAANEEIASKAIIREGLILIIPHAIGDLASKVSGTEFILERPDIYEFEKNLISIGIEESDAKRFATSSGRSWTVFRRQQSNNPSLKKPKWLDSKQSESLSVLCLMNAWNSHNHEDKQIVERIYGCKYEKIEKDLQELFNQDDTPVLYIGGVWKAKSPLELFSLVGGRIPSDQINRFFEVAKEMLSIPDPQLELPDEKRWMAQVYGKTHPYSELLFESICDSLIKLAVLGSEYSGLGTINMEARVSNFVTNLLEDADDVRWLSLASYLPTLAEAAPNAFITAIENSLKTKEKPVTRLITETGDSGAMGRCWHSGLLWALENLAWSSRTFARVALILAQLSFIPIKGNWANKPSGSLLGMFRTWMPQTSTDLAGRIQVLDLLIEKEPEAAYQLLENLLAKGSQMASPANRPDWRDDDAGAGQKVSPQEYFDMIIATKDRLLKLAENNADRIASLIENTSLAHKEELHGVLILIQPFLNEAHNDSECEKLRESLRDIIHWHRNYDDADKDELNKWLEPIESCYERLSPKNLVTRHCWLFNSYWVDLPYRVRDDDHIKRPDILTQERLEAVEEIYATDGISGIDELILTCLESGTVGQILSKVSWNEFSWVNWIIEKGGDFVSKDPFNLCISSYLRIRPSEKVEELLHNIVSLGKQQCWKPEKLAQLFILASPEQKTWKILNDCGEEAVSFYWQKVPPQHCRNDEDIEFVLGQMINAERPLSALQYCKYLIEKTPAKQLFNLLQMFLQGKEIDGAKLDSWHFSKMLKHLEISDEIDTNDLIQLEFAFYPALYHRNGEGTELLYKTLTTDSELFNDLIRLAYKPKHGEYEEIADISKVAVETALDILRNCKRIPGVQEDDTVDEDAMLTFIDAVRTQSEIDDRIDICDIIIGEFLAHCDSNADDTWPLTSIARLLDRTELEYMRRGFSTGIYNKRGVTTRSMHEGGIQERKLAEYYKEQASHIQHIFPNTSAMLEGIAKHYEFDAKREDDEAGLRKERF
ncbi:MAG: hypothetical protein QM484_01030 [Woeseiaceae bacterium]